MYDARRIVPGLVVFIALVGLPFWINLARGAEASVPTIVKPARETRCIEDAATMRREHMQILVQWRDDVVRNAVRTYTATDGRQFQKSLTGTCLGCHSDKKGSCDRCHEYLRVQPYCWDCHVESAGGR